MCGRITDTRGIFGATWQGYARAFPSSTRIGDREMDVAFAGIAVPLFNLAFPKTSEAIRREEFARLIGEFGKILSPRGVQGLLLVRNGQIAEDTGMEAMFRMPGMVAGDICARQRRW